MSLWEKWENEKRKKQGLEVKRTKLDVEIHDTRVRPNLQRQVMIVVLTLFACLSLVAVAMLVLLVVPIMVFQHFEAKRAERGQ